jgi:hypothetical protein
VADRPRDRRRGGALVRRRLGGASEDQAHQVLVSAAQALYGASHEQYAVQYKSWQKELWAYARSVGEYGSVMDWFAAGISRHHLVAGTIKPGVREPTRLESGPAAFLVDTLVAQARGGETQYMHKWGRQLGIPGMGFFVAWDDPVTKQRVFDVKSAEVIRRSTKPLRDPVTGQVARRPNGEVITGYDVRVAPDAWEKLPYESLVRRIYRPDDEYDYLPTSWSQPALATLRELDLYNRHIVATLLSRLVFNGMLLIPNEVSLPVNPQFKDAPDPFIAELLAIASRGIKDPGSPASAIPFPIRVPSEYIEKFKHLIIATGVDPKIIQARDSARNALTKMLPAPPEAFEGKSNLNHWNAWADSADNVKYYFGPTMEILVGGLTEFYLWPMLQSLGESIVDDEGGRVVVWYDNSDLVSDPDNSENAQNARDRMAITDEAYLSYLALDGDDAPTKDERRDMILVDLARQGLPIPDSFYLLYPDEKPPPQAQPPLPPTGGVDPVTGAPRPSGPSTAGAPVNGRSRGQPAAPARTAAAGGAPAPTTGGR